MNGHFVLYLLMSAMMMLWSANFIVGKVALREFPPFLLGALRIGLAGIFLAPIFWWRAHRGLDEFRIGPGLPLLFVLAACTVTNQILFLAGLHQTSVAHSALILGLGPMFVLLMAASAGLEKITVRKVAGMSIALAGVAVLAHQASSSSVSGGRETQATLGGDALIALASLMFSAFGAFGKKITKHYSALAMNVFAYLVGGAVLAPLALWKAHEFSFGGVSTAGWASLVYMALFPSAICYLIYYYALSHIPASRVSAFLYLQPLIATALAVAFLGERLTAPILAGGTVIFTGIYLTESG